MTWSGLNSVWLKKGIEIIRYNTCSVCDIKAQHVIGYKRLMLGLGLRSVFLCESEKNQTTLPSRIWFFTNYSWYQSVSRREETDVGSRLLTADEV